MNHQVNQNDDGNQGAPNDSMKPQQPQDAQAIQTNQGVPTPMLQQQQLQQQQPHLQQEQHSPQGHQPAQYMPYQQQQQDQQNMSQGSHQKQRFRSDDGQNQGQTQINHSKYKTAKCRHFENNGHCVMGDKCNFAHGDSELKEPTPGGSQGPQGNPGGNPGGYPSSRGGQRRGGRMGYNPNYQSRGQGNNMGYNQFQQQDFSQGSTPSQGAPIDGQQQFPLPSFMGQTQQSFSGQDGSQRGGMSRGGGRGDYNSSQRGTGFVRRPPRGNYPNSNIQMGQSNHMGSQHQPSYYQGGSSAPQQQNNFDGQNGGQGQNGYKQFIPSHQRGNYKTELCKYFQNGNCPYQGKCSFAHGPQELKEKIHQQGVPQGNSYPGSQSSNGGGNYQGQQFSQGSQQNFNQNMRGGGSQQYQGHGSQTPLPMPIQHMPQPNYQPGSQQPNFYQSQWQMPATNSMNQLSQQQQQQQMFLQNQIASGMPQQQQPIQMQGMWQQQQQPAQLQHVDNAPHRRIHIKVKDHLGNSQISKSISVYFTQQGHGNQQVLAAITHAEQQAEQGNVGKVEECLINLQVNNMIMFKENQNESNNNGQSTTQQQPSQQQQQPQQPGAQPQIAVQAPAQGKQ